MCDHSCLPSRDHPNEESWKVSGLIKTKSRVNQVDHLTKRRRCTERDQVIPWYGNLILEVMLLDHDEPTNYKEGTMSPNSDKWLEAMRSEI